MSDSSPLTPRQLVTEVFGPKMTKEVWTGNYDKVLPMSVQTFDLSAVLPSVFYMFRFGWRRGAGRFVNIFGPSEGTKSQRRKGTTAHSVASTLVRGDDFLGVDGQSEQAILADLLLCYCLDNRWYELGRTRPIQRIAPTHYLASWGDLPDNIGHLRWVPETITAILANQKRVEHVEETKRDGKPTWFPVVGGPEGNVFEENELLKAVGQGMRRPVEVGDLADDRFDENTAVGIDQLLVIRIAQALRKAPDPVAGRDARKISNQRPIATKTSREFSEDMRKFVRTYASVVPRQAFMEMMESCMAVGLTAILASVVEVVLAWGETGEVVSDLGPAPIFVDSSAGADRQLRNVAEQSMDDYVRRVERFPAALMALRLLDYQARNNTWGRKHIAKLRSTPVATERIAFLGEVLHDRHPEARRILDRLEDRAEELAEAAAANQYPAVARTLRNDNAQPNPVWRLADALSSLHGRILREDLHKLIDSVLHAERPNGLAAKRQVSRKEAGGGTRRRPVRSLVLTDTALEYLVHRHVLPPGSGNTRRPLSFIDFVAVLRRRYGFCVDEAPPGLTISNDLLQRNRGRLERRLRDLGLLFGVNDAERMKRLHPRFKGGAP